MQIQGKSWKDKLRAKIVEVAFYSKSFNDFLQRCTECGIEYVYTPRNKVKLKFRLKDEGQQKFTRADTLEEEYTPERITEQIEQIQKSHAIMERLAEKKAPEKPVITPKTESKPTEPTKSKDLTEEEFFTLLGEPTTPETNPPESQAPEKKENIDGWTSIRGMSNSAQIITELESVGIHSVGEFTYFNMQASKDISDISEKLSVLKKQIGSIDTLIIKIKQCTELSATYKEYQGLSGLKQKRFKKKNTDAIDSYEQSDKYIKEHIKAYKIDGKMPTVAELKERSSTLKDEYNSNLKELQALEKKHAVTSRYSRTVRNFINQQTNKHASEQSRQRRLTQQKKKDTLE
ncbi:MAG: conjugal transfer protein [Clostridium sp.]|nr:conjugal transfer protein [Clostridium sp.]